MFRVKEQKRKRSIKEVVNYVNWFEPVFHHVLVLQLMILKEIFECWITEKQ